MGASNSARTATAVLLLLTLSAVFFRPDIARSQTATVAANTGQSCAGTRFGSNLGCTANDFSANLQFTQPSATAISSCRLGEVVTIDLIATLQSGPAFRYDGGIFIGEMGNNPELNDATKSCSLGVFPLAPAPFSDSDGDSCGDYNSSSTAQLLIQGVQVYCIPAPGTNRLNVPFVLSYTQNTGIACTAATIVPGTKSKCTSDSSAQVTSVGVRGFVRITKLTNPSATAGTFSFTASSTATPSPAAFSLAHAQMQTVEVDLDPAGGTRVLTITESALAGWDPTVSITCATPSGGSAAAFVSINNTTRTITATLDSTNYGAYCTVTNTKLPTLTLRKTSVANTGAFPFSAGNGFGSQTLTTIVSGVQVTGATRVLSTINTATTITETVPVGYKMTAASCTGMGAGGTATPNLAAGTLLLNAAATAPGSNIVCSFTDGWMAFDIAKSANTANISSLQTLAYTITITNTGGAPLNGPSLTDVLLQGGSPRTLTSGPVRTSGDTNSNNNLDIGEVWTYSATYAVSQSDMDNGASLVNTATFTPVEIAAKSATATTTITQIPEVSVDKTSNVAMVTAAGDTILYSLAVTNSGNITVSSLTISDTLGTPVCPVSGNATIATIAPGSTETCTYSYLATQVEFDTNGGGDGDIDNAASVSGNTPAGPVNGSDAHAVTLVLNPSLSIVKTADDTTDVVAGQTITYTYTITNNGNITIDNVGVTDTHDGYGPPPVPGSEILVTDNGTIGDSTDASVNGIWDVLAPGDVIRFLGTYVVTQADVDNL